MKKQKKGRETNTTEFPDTPEGARAMFRQLKESGTVKPEQLSELEASIQRLERLAEFNQHAWETTPKLASAVNGNRNEEAAMIIATIYLNKNRRILENEKKLPTMPADEREWHDKWIDKTLSSDPLLESYKKRILKAVCDFDRAFLKSLIAEMDLCEFSSGVRNRNLVAVISCHHFFERKRKKSPTNRELLASIKEFWPGTRMDERTLAFICKSHKLPLAPARLGRPKKIRK